MKLVIVSEFFYPYKTSTQKILTELAEDLVKYGLEVDILTTKNSYREKQQQLPKYENYKGMNIKRIFSTSRNRDSKFGRLINYIIFTLGVFLNLLFKKNYDKVLFVSNPPLVSYVGYLIKKLRGKRYVYLVHDVYPDVAEKLGIIKKGSIISNLMNYMNRKIYLNSERIIALGKDMKNIIVSKGISEGKISIITNWADSKINFEKIACKEVYKKYNIENSFNIVYTGNISKVHDIDTIIKVAQRLKNNKDIKFLFIGNGNRKEYIKELKLKENLKNIELRDYVFGEEYNNLLNCASIFISTLQKGIEGLGVPSKTYTYMAVGKPIIAIMSKESEVGNMVNKYTLGKQFSNNDVDGIVDYIIKIQKDRKLYKEVCNNVNYIFKKKYERKKVTKKFYEVILNNKLGDCEIKI
ncbi:glycosyltransferase family 4 protein [Clostridium tarantellae]|uniref:Glycosyltransferase n=1 Tax=Clostridium tarantellae TaxID=39493 RepID=A0A6I1MN17_9CLOT|nr:glycosyltransferase family 4 protein [Clostridium tarantellae]MPQ43507.1 glycosyltransferase [Clostridium tarantellae]